MYWSVVSTVALAVASAQPVPLTAQETAVWNRIKPSIVYLQDAGASTGAAAMIDASGLFVANSGSVPSRDIVGKLVDGRTIRLRLKNTDGTTQLSVLKIVGQLPQGIRPLGRPTGNESPGTPMFAILPSGPLRAEFVASSQVGRVGPQLRILPLSEIRFESSSDPIGGALLVTYQREFMGTLNATLAKREQADTLPQNNLMGSPGGGFGGGLGRNQVKAIPKELIGPAEMTVAYTVAPEVVSRVMEDFTSEDGRVAYPTLGVFCRNAPDMGALVQRVVPGSGAEKAGLKPGDIILDINGNTIRNQIDFSRVMFRQQVGTNIPVRIRRGSYQHVLRATVGRQAD